VQAVSGAALVCAEQAPQQARRQRGVAAHRAAPRRCGLGGGGARRTLPLLSLPACGPRILVLILILICIRIRVAAVAVQSGGGCGGGGLRGPPMMMTPLLGSPR